MTINTMFHFTIRDVLWLMVVVALGVGWFYHSWGLWIGKTIAEEEIRELNKALAECGKRLDELKP